MPETAWRFESSRGHFDYRAAEGPGRTEAAGRPKQRQFATEYTESTESHRAASVIERAFPPSTSVNLCDLCGEKVRASGAHETRASAHEARVTRS